MFCLIKKEAKLAVQVYIVLQELTDIFDLFNLYKNHNYMAAPQSDLATLSAFEAF